MLVRPEAYCLSRTDFITTISLFFFSCGIFILSPACLAIFMLSTPMRLCGWCLTPQHWPQALMKNSGICCLRYDLFIPTVDDSGLESTIPNQWSLAEKASQMINSILNTLFFHPNVRGDEWGKRDGVWKIKINKFFITAMIHESLLIIFPPDLWTKKNHIFFLSVLL